jgi:predicted transcriptional regulator
VIRGRAESGQNIADPALSVYSNQITPSDLGTFVSTVAIDLRKIGTGVEQPAESKPKPAVAARRSIGLGKKQKLLKRHLAVEHSLLPGQYRESFGLEPDYPIVAPNYAQQRRERALKVG